MTVAAILVIIGSLWFMLWSVFAIVGITVKALLAQETSKSDIFLAVSMFVLSVIAYPIGIGMFIGSTF